ncbi:MAG: type VII secretion target [Actinomycetes bacterium]
MRVVPAELRAAATSADGAAQTAAGGGASLRAADAADTGRADSRGALATVLGGLTACVQALATVAAADADALRAAADAYESTDACAVPR